ncbi:MAG: GNAT family N-acetyltransferase [Alphaproteobacteria bacterium]|nr:GNAT family N-acetyltransferase [Alphaproteobacteria bacterium]MBU4039560.1 GNAT family N-acetyltransferase [Alphaproteobacteria bacterium]MBU4137869.1 GNAT family N-acetyltransferase [Alphaproteobacteria bacterium]
MSAGEAEALNIIEPFNPDKHDRAAFSCGIDQVDNFFKKTANKLSKADNLRVWVMTVAGGGLIGFYATNAHSVDYQDLPAKYARTRPGHGQIPAAYISMIGVDQGFQGKGYGGDLLIDCLRRLSQASEALGVAVVMLDVLDCGDPEQRERRSALYKGYGFESLPTNPSRLFLPMTTVKALIAEEP